MKRYFKICAIDFLWLVFAYIGLFITFVTHGEEITYMIFPEIVIQILYFPEMVIFIIPSLLILNFIFFVPKMKHHLGLLIIFQFIIVYTIQIYMAIRFVYSPYPNKDVEYDFQQGIDYVLAHSHTMKRVELTLGYILILFICFMILKWYLVKRLSRDYDLSRTTEPNPN